MKCRAATGLILTLAAIYLPPWRDWLGMFPAHMLRHMGLVALAAPLMVLALPEMSRRASPPVVLGAFAEFTVVWIWHLPALHHAAQDHLTIRLTEQAMFLIAGWAVWASALTAREPLLGAGGLFLTSLHMTMLGALLILAPVDLYAGSHGHAANLAGQQLGGMLMLAIGTPIYLLGGLMLSRQTLKGDAT